MPRVPTYDNLQVAPNSLPQTRLTVADASQGVGEQGIQLGQAMQSAGNVLNKVAIDMQQQMDKVRVDAALNQVKEDSLRLTFDQQAGYTNIKGNDALNRPDGKPMDIEYSDTLYERISAISRDLGNEQQRMAFLSGAQGMATNLRGNVQQHMASEAKEYQLSVAEGIQSTAVREIAINYRDQSAVAAAELRIRGQVYQQAKLQGKSAEWQESQTRAVVSGAHAAAIAQALGTGDVQGAQAYFKQHNERMDAKDWITANNNIQTVYSTQMGMQAASGVTGEIVQSFNPTDLDRMMAVKRQIESNGQQFEKDGKTPRTSKAGAIGIAQVMPATGPEAAKLAGLPWDEGRFRTDAKYNAALGEAYFMRKLKDTGGDVAKAYASYNAGYGRVQQDEAAAKKWNAEHPDQPRSWLSFSPAETQGYVAKAMRLLNQGSASPRPMTQLEAQERMYASNPQIKNNPVADKAAREQLAANFKLAEQDRKDKAESAYAEAIKLGDSIGWRVSAIPQELKSQIDPADLSKLQGAFDTLGKGDNATNKAVYVRLTGNDAGLKKMSEAQIYALRSDLSESDFKQITDRWAKLNGNSGSPDGGKNQAGDLPSGYVKAHLFPRLEQIGIDIAPKNDAKKAELNNIIYTMDKLMLDAQAKAGVKFNDAQAAGFLDEVMNKRVKLKGGWFSSDEEVPLFKVGKSQVADATIVQIKRNFAKAGVSEPTDAQIMQAYMLGKFKR